MTQPSPPTTPTEARALVLEALQEVAPDVDPATVESGTRLQEDLDLDSMDFLNLLAALSDQSGLDIPESDYARLATVEGCVSYLLGKDAVA
jgi:acyl carrier protein